MRKLSSFICKMNFSVKSKTAKKAVLLVFSSILVLGFLQADLPNEELPFPLPDVSADASGKASLAVPIELLKGTKGIEPEISLSYSSGTGTSQLRE